MTGMMSWSGCKSSARTLRQRSARCRTKRGATECRRTKFRSNERTGPDLATGTHPDKLPALVRGDGDFLLDRGADQIAPLGPGTVVILHVAEAQQIFQHEPGVRAAFADAAVSDHFFRAVNSLLAVELLQSVRGFEGAVFVGGLRPGNIGCARNVSGALRGFGKTRRRQNLSGEFVHGTNVHQLRGLLFIEEGVDVFLAGADGFVRAGGAVGGGRNFWRVGSQRALFFHPLFASAVD